MESPENLDKIVNVPCSACGNELTFDPAKEMLLCPSCGNTQTLPKANDMVVERSFADAANLAAQPRGLDAPSKVFHCNNCGGNTSVSPDEVAFNCPFCGSSNVNDEAHAARCITPSGILPFKITKKTALEKFKTWIGKGFFAPKKLANLAKLDKIRGVYLPFWTYDAETFSEWTAESGYYYYTTESYTDSEGNVKTKQVRHTRWSSSSGYHQKAFDDILVLGSSALDQDLVEKIFPFELGDLVNYDGRYILGLESEVYQKDVNEAFDIADQLMDAEIRAEVKNRVPGDTHRALQVRTRKSGITFKHILLPTWIAAYTYKDKVYRFLVNGQTGKINGRKPKSVWKIIAFIALIAAVIGTIVFFLTR